MKRELSTDNGSAILEFLIIGVLVLVPLLYVLLTALRIESAVMASTQAVREAGRAFMMSDSLLEAKQNAQTAARLAMSDQGFELPTTALSITCSGSCLSPSSSTHVRLEWLVDLPWLPTTFGSQQLGYPVTVDSELRMDSYRSDVGIS